MNSPTSVLEHLEHLDTKNSPKIAHSHIRGYISSRLAKRGDVVYINDKLYKVTDNDMAKNIITAENIITRKVITFVTGEEDLRFQSLDPDTFDERTVKIYQNINPNLNPNLNPNN